MTHGELFAGISGFGLGFERAGIKTVWCVEKDKACQSVLRRHHPGVPIYDDVRGVGVHNLEPVDIISFGSPCQDLSVAGKRKGLNGERSGLFFEAIRIIRDLRPAIAIWENVPGALSSHGGRDFGAALDALAQSGALDIGWAILDAQWFGVAQRRRRLFVVADFRDRRAGQILSIPYGSKGDTPPSRQTWPGTADTIGTSADRVSGRAGASAPALAYGGNNTEGDSAPMVFESRYARNGCGKPGSIVPPLKAQSGQSGKGDGAPLVGLQMNYIRKERIGDYAGSLAAQPGDAQFNGVWDKRFGVRRLMPVECERLQGFPDGWTDGQPDSSRYRQLGNAVAVPCAWWLGLRILGVA